MLLKENQTRERINFNEDWLFRLERETGFRSVRLPHDWSLEYPFDENAPSCGSGGFVETGIGWYQKKFTVDANQIEGKRYLLSFEGAYMLTEVWLNGHTIGKHVYGYTPFSFDITEALNKDGKENFLEVKVDNSMQPGSRWYSGSGITRKVWLLVVNETHIAPYGVFVRTKSITDNVAELEIRTEVAGIREKQSITVESTVMGADGRICFGCAEQLSEAASDLIQCGKVVEPQLWEPDHPTLYTVISRIYEGDQLLDEVQTQIGIRTAEFHQDQGFLLNGKRVKLKGVCLHHDGGCVGAAVPSVIWKRRLEKLKDMGANAIRISHNPPDVAILDYCDQMGLLVMDEAFDEWKIMKGKELGSNTHESHGYSRFFEECHEEDISTMVLRDRNHPSVILWSIGNEVPEQTQEDGYLLARHLKEICKRLDPDRAITQANDQIVAEPAAAKESFLNELDVVGYNYMGRWRKRAETYCEADKLAHPDWCMIGTESSSVGGIRGEYEFTIDEHAGWYRFPYFSAPVEAGRQLRFLLTRDYLAGDFIWTGIDYLGEARWPAHGAMSGCLDTCGFEKDSFYFYRSIWNEEEDTLHLLPHWNLKEQGIREGQIIPVLAYTNMEEAELFLNGKSYGKKALSFPAYGMTEKYGHYDVEPVPVHTNDLFLSWDVPYEPGELVLVGYRNGKVVKKETVRTAGAPAKLVLHAYQDKIAVSDEVCQLEIALVDEAGNLCQQSDTELLIEVTGGILLGVDSGNLASQDSYKKNSVKAFHGRAFAVIGLNEQKAGTCTIRVKADGLKEAEQQITFTE